jgi:ABC-2 type transport system ATP-binding protein
MIEAVGLSKRYGSTRAVEDLSFVVPPGQITGFLGPNGSGKSTTMRLVLALDTPTSGTVTVNGRPYRELRRPLLEVGAVLDAHAMHGGRSGYNNLRGLAFSNGIPARRVDEVLEVVGLGPVARRRVRGFSLGMAQRLGIAAALLGDPGILIFDEPVNGLDPEGVLWLRTLLKSFAAEGRTVLVSSHLMSEMAITADRLLIIGRGHLIAQTSISDLLEQSSGGYLRVRSPDAPDLAAALRRQGAEVNHEAADTLRVSGVTSHMVGTIARIENLTLRELSEHRASLEEIYMQLTSNDVEYHAANRLLPAAAE